MNWKRGLFRIWLVGTAAWLLPLVIFAWDGISAPDTPSSRALLTPKGFPSVADVVSGKWKPSPNAPSWSYEEALCDPPSSPPCVTIEAPTTSPSLSTIIPRLFNVLALGMIVPMLTLIIGVAIRWAIKGFRTH
jgi:hypothetical protein